MSFSAAPSPSHWDTDESFPLSDWQYDVANDDTRLGYHEWVAAQREAQDADTSADTSADPPRPTAFCGCGYALIWVDGDWQHDAAPYLWGDDHDPDAPHPTDQGPVAFWNEIDGV